VYSVDVACKGTLPAAEYANLEIVDADLLEQVWTVDEAQAIRGRVVDARGEPVGDIGIRAIAKSDSENIRARARSGRATSSPDDGNFELLGLLPGSYELLLSGQRPITKQPIVVELPASGDLEGVVLELPATGTIRGRVVDDQGVGLADVAIAATPTGYPRESHATSDEQGNFTLEHVRPGEVRVEALDESGMQVRRKPGSGDDDEQGVRVEVVADETATVELVIERHDGSIRGRVVDVDGVPVDDAFVRATRMSESATSGGVDRRSLHWGGGTKPTLSEQDGTFVVENLEPGKYVVFAHRKGGGEATVEDVELGSEVELRIGATSMLAGVVVATGAASPDRFDVTVRDDAAGVYVSDSFFRTAGRFEIRELPAGKYMLTVASQLGNAELEVELAAGQTRDDLELRLQPLVTLKGRVVDADSKAPLPDMVIKVGGHASGWSKLFTVEPGKHLTDAEGRFELAQSPTGEIYLSVQPLSGGLTSDYGHIVLGLTSGDEPAVQDVGDILMVARRLKSDEQAGDLGFELKQQPSGTPTSDQRCEVALIRPGGPADGSGLAVGDVIESVGGISVVGGKATYFEQLTKVKAGTVLELEIAGGGKVVITVGAAR
jgi:hypothetical protein